MQVVFRGDAMRVFSPDKPGCEAAEVEPGHFVIEDATTNDNCAPDVSLFHYGWGTDKEEGRY